MKNQCRRRHLRDVLDRRTLPVDIEMMVGLAGIVEQIGGRNIIGAMIGDHVRRPAPITAALKIVVCVIVKAVR